MANYQDSNILFTNVTRPSFTTSGRIVKSDYTLEGENIINTDGPVINAIDIDWNGAQLDDQTLNTTGEVLSRLNDISYALAIGMESLSDRIDGLDFYDKETSDEKYSNKDHQHVQYITSMIHEHGEYATETYVDNKIETLIGEAPEALNTLREISDKLFDNDDAVAALTSEIASKANKEHTHNEYITSLAHSHNAYLTSLAHSHTEYSSSSHSHEEYATADHSHNLAHSHSAYLVSLAHSHSGYATTDHSHNAYLTSLAHSHSAYLVSLAHMHSEYATETYVNEQISELIGTAPQTLDTLGEIAAALNDNATMTMVSEAISTKANAEDVYTKEETDEIIDGMLSIKEAEDIYQPLGNYLTEHQDISGKANVEDVYTKEETDEMFEGFLTLKEAEDTYQPLGNYLTEHQDISGKANIGDSYTKEESDAKYLTEHQSLTGYATETYVSEEIAKVVGNAPETLDTLKEIADALNDNATLTDVTNLITVKANATDVYTKAEVENAFQPRGEYLTEHQDISGKANVGDSYTKVESDGKYLTEHQSLADYATQTYVDNAVEAIVGAAPENFDTLKELADTMADLKVVDVEAVPAVEGEHFTQEEIDAAQEGDEAYGKTVDDWKVEPVEGIAEQSHNMTIAEFVNNSIQSVDEKEDVAKVKTKYNALLSLLNLRDTDVNNVIVNQALSESNTVTFDDGSVDNITIPVTTAAYTVTAPLEDNSTVTLSSNKYMTLFNTSEEPVSTTIQYDAQGATGSGTTVYLVGEYDTLTLENISPNVKTGQEPAKVNNVVITEDNTKNLTLTLDLQDGAVITNNSATDVTISDKNNEATVLTVVAPNSTVTLNGGTFETLTATVSDNTLIIKKTAHIGDLVVKHGNVKVEVPRESDISNIITGTITLGDEHSFLIVDHNNFAAARHNELEDYYNNYPAEANQDGETWPAFTPSKFPWLVVNHEFDGNTELTVYYQGEQVFGDWKPSAQVEQEGGNLVNRTYAILSVPEDLGLTQYTESAAGNEILLNPEDIEVRLVNGKVDYLHDEITSANISKLTSTGTHVLTENITKNGRFAPGIFASDDIVWDLNGHDITFTNTQGYANFLLRGTLHLEINGNGTVRNNAGDYGFWTATEGAKVVINGGSYYAATHVLYAENGTIEVNGGEFHLTDENTADKDINGNFKFLLNCHDAEYTAGTAKIIVRGGTFYGFNPAETYGEPNGPVSYVADGYKSVQIGEENGLKIYQVQQISE